MSISFIFTLFIFTSFLGWIYECLYCTLKSAKWQNRGFFFGPVCPIYGIGCLFAYGFYQKFEMAETATSVSKPMVFMICAVGSAILEYGTSYILEKRFHARWWDYSQVPFNLNGRICLPATLGFGMAGLLIIKKLLPALAIYLLRWDTLIPVWIEEIMALILMGVFGADVALSISSVTGLLEALDKLEAEFDATLESAYKPIGNKQHVLARKITKVKHVASDKIVDMTEYRIMLADAAKRLTPGQIKKLATIVRFTSEKYTGLAATVSSFLVKRNENRSKDIVFSV